MNKSSQVTFIYIAHLTIQIVSKQLHNIKIGTLMQTHTLEPFNSKTMHMCVCVCVCVCMCVYECVVVCVCLWLCSVCVVCVVCVCVV